MEANSIPPQDNDDSRRQSRLSAKEQDTIDSLLGLYNGNTSSSPRKNDPIATFPAPQLPAEGMINQGASANEISMPSNSNLVHPLTMPTDPGWLSMSSRPSVCPTPTTPQNSQPLQLLHMSSGHRQWMQATTNSRNRNNSSSHARLPRSLRPQRSGVMSRRNESITSRASHLSSTEPMPVTRIEVKEKINSLVDKNFELECQRDGLNEQVGDLQTLVDTLQSALDVRDDEIKHYTATIAENEKKLENAAATEQELRKRLLTQTTNTQGGGHVRRHNFEQLRAERASLREELDYERKKWTDTDAKLAEALERVEEHEETIQWLTEKLDIARTEQEELSATNSSLERQVEDLTTTKASLENRLRMTPAFGFSAPPSRSSFMIPKSRSNLGLAHPLSSVSSSVILKLQRHPSVPDPSRMETDESDVPAPDFAMVTDNASRSASDSDSNQMDTDDTSTAGRNTPNNAQSPPRFLPEHRLSKRRRSPKFGSNINRSARLRSPKFSKTVIQKRTKTALVHWRAVLARLRNEGKLPTFSNPKLLNILNITTLGGQKVGLSLEDLFPHIDFLNNWDQFQEESIGFLWGPYLADLGSKSETPEALSAFVQRDLGDVTIPLSLESHPIPNFSLEDIEIPDAETMSSNVDPIIPVGPMDQATIDEAMNNPDPRSLDFLAALNMPPDGSNVVVPNEIINGYANGNTGSYPTALPDGYNPNFPMISTEQEGNIQDMLANAKWSCIYCENKMLTEPALSTSGVIVVAKSDPADLCVSITPSAPVELNRSKVFFIQQEPQWQSVSVSVDAPDATIGSVLGIDISPRAMSIPAGVETRPPVPRQTLSLSKVSVLSVDPGSAPEPVVPSKVPVTPEGTATETYTPTPEQKLTTSGEVVCSTSPVPWTPEPTPETRLTVSSVSWKAVGPVPTNIVVAGSQRNAMETAPVSTAEMTTSTVSGLGFEPEPMTLVATPQNAKSGMAKSNPATEVVLETSSISAITGDPQMAVASTSVFCPLSNATKSAPVLSVSSISCESIDPKMANFSGTCSAAGTGTAKIEPIPKPAMSISSVVGEGINPEPTKVITTVIGSCPPPPHVDDIRPTWGLTDMITTAAVAPVPAGFWVEVETTRTSTSERMALAPIVRVNAGTQTIDIDAEAEIADEIEIVSPVLTSPAKVAPVVKSVAQAMWDACNDPRSPWKWPTPPPPPPPSKAMVIRRRMESSARSARASIMTGLRCIWNVLSSKTFLATFAGFCLMAVIGQLMMFFFVLDTKCETGYRARSIPINPKTLYRILDWYSPAIPSHKVTELIQNREAVMNGNAGFGQCLASLHHCRAELGSVRRLGVRASRWAGLPTGV